MQWHRAKLTNHWILRDGLRKAAKSLRKRSEMRSRRTLTLNLNGRWCSKKVPTCKVTSSVFNVGSRLERSRVICLEENDHCSLGVSPFPATWLSDSGPQTTYISLHPEQMNECVDTGCVGYFDYDLPGYISLDKCYGALCAMVY